MSGTTLPFKLSAFRLSRLYRFGLFALTLVCIGAVFALTACSSQDADESSKSEPSVKLRVFAPESLSEALPEVERLYSAKNPDIGFEENTFDLSTQLVSDLEYLVSHPAPSDGGDESDKVQAARDCDILFTATASSMNDAADAGVIDASTCADILENDLVICASTSSDVKIAQLSDLNSAAVSSIGLTDPSKSDEGLYAAETLQTANLATIKESSTGAVSVTYKDAIADKVKDDALYQADLTDSLVKGNVRVAFLFGSDVVANDQIRDVYTVPSAAHAAIRYPGAVSSTTDHGDEARAFLDFCLTDKDAKKIFSSHGLTVVA
ncbi:MAG: molybdate ABC transporter substrate-binding protein [Eggerthellaceae bacterium]